MLNVTGQGKKPKGCFEILLLRYKICGGGEVAATQTGIRWAQEVLPDPSSIVNDLTKYIWHLEGR